MPIYEVIVHYSSKKKYEIEASDIETAEEKAIERCQEEEAPDNIDDTESYKSDNQYTDQQELQDEERRYEEKFGT
jgi:hypothetical protein